MKGKTAGQRAKKFASNYRDVLREIRIAQKCELLPGQVEHSVYLAWLSGYRAGKREAKNGK